MDGVSWGLAGLEMHRELAVAGLGAMLARGGS